ncbi:hypothetical protein SAMN05421505_101181 [Sinosporangium album]|uniref:Uncharacterized protein n=1 Tax=Sinosporangium album TaxID=504805 RepID=A0A1G7QZ97_9ACTN|nr:hypothetical protein [Sinosporangium album]SDG03817.1 hypothetical protein SAMN05421505_101181 [Sinosporangium album]
MRRFITKISAFAAWAGKNADGAIALILAIVVGVLGILPDDQVPDALQNQLISGATLVILALVATALIRDRSRQEPLEKAFSTGALAELPERLGRLERLESLVEGTRRALDDAALVRVLGSSNEITTALAKARQDAGRWSFKGGTGTYIRAVTLPECVAAARRDKRHLAVTLEIIDPSDVEVCESYAHYRRSLSDHPDGTGEVWTTDRARKESYATVLAAFWHRQRYGLLDIAVGLSSTMTTFRWDLSSHSLVMTVEDPNRAMFALAGTFYYECSDTELRTSLEQARRVPMERYRSVPLSNEPTIEEVLELFERVGLPLPKSYTDHDVVSITRKALRAKDPYGQVPP